MKKFRDTVGTLFVALIALAGSFGVLTSPADALDFAAYQPDQCPSELECIDQGMAFDSNYCGCILADDPSQHSTESDSGAGSSVNCSGDDPCAPGYVCFDEDHDDYGECIYVAW